MTGAISSSWQSCNTAMAAADELNENNFCNWYVVVKDTKAVKNECKVMGYVESLFSRAFCSNRQLVNPENYTDAYKTRVTDCMDCLGSTIESIANLGLMIVSILQAFA